MEITILKSDGEICGEREVFDCDHLVVSPSVNTLKKLNKLAFAAMGDMNWHAHVGIPRIAVQHKIPIIFWENMDMLICVVSFL